MHPLGADQANNEMRPRMGLRKIPRPPSPGMGQPRYDPLRVGGGGYRHQGGEAGLGPHIRV